MKSETNKSIYTKPLIFNCYKPKDISSFDVVRHFKRNLPKGYGKIGHFGTLDPFACGVLMIGVAGAARLNNFIHDCLPKTYIADGILGIETETGDMTVEPSNTDESEYLRDVISQFDTNFIQKSLSDKFLGVYLQSPHTYSAAKHEGKKLHEWAREGVKIEKEKKERFIHEINVLEFDFPKLKIEFTVSSGTYIRTLFSECANFLGTLGTLEDLERTKVGHCTLSNSIAQKDWPVEREFELEKHGLDIREVLNFSTIVFDSKEERLYSNGVKLAVGREKEIIKGEVKDHYWVENTEKELLGLASIVDSHIVSEFNFPSSSK